LLPFIDQMRNAGAMADDGSVSAMGRRQLRPTRKANRPCGCARVGSRHMLRQPTQAKQKVVK